MFGVSFTELLLIGAVTLLIVGPQRLPKMLGTLGKWSAKLRRLTNEVRYQSGIDDILRKEGISGGLNELRQLRDVARGNWSSLGASAVAGRSKSSTTQKAAGAPASMPGSIANQDPFAHVQNDRSREYPSEGCDAYGALPDDFTLSDEDEAAGTAPGAVPASSAPAQPAAAPSSVDPTANADPPANDAEPAADAAVTHASSDAIAPPSPTWNDQRAEKS